MTSQKHMDRAEKFVSYFNLLGLRALIVPEKLAEAFEEVERETREECARIAKGTSDEFDFQEALAEHRDSEYGSHSGRVAASKAICPPTQSDKG